MRAVGVCVSSDKQATYKGELRARCEVSDGGRDCRMFNLTPRRAFIESFIPHVAGTRVQLSFNLPNGHQIRTEGIVSRHHFAEGFDVDFVGLAAADHEQIARLVG